MRRVGAKLGHDGERQPEEKEANGFARRTFVRTEADARIAHVLTARDAIELASGLGVHPAIIAGRIHHARHDFKFGMPNLFTSLKITTGDDD